jgi:hypothetical protein
VQDYNDELKRLVGLEGKTHTRRVDLAAERERLSIESAGRGLHDDHRATERRPAQLDLSLRQLDAGFNRDDGYYSDLADR